MLSACGVQANSAGAGCYSTEETELKVELTERLFAQDTDSNVSLLHTIHCLPIAFIIYFPSTWNLHFSILLSLYNKQTKKKWFLKEKSTWK